MDIQRKLQKAENVSRNWKALLKNMQHDDKSSKRGKDSRKRKLDKKEKSSSPEIWFDDVDISEINGEVATPPQKKVREDVKSTTVELVTGKYSEPTKYVALDCEMVGTGFEGEDSMLARCSLVNRFGHVLYDKYVAPQEWVTDFRTKYSGIRVEDVRSVKAEDFSVVQKEVSDLLKGRILVGHALRNDLKALLLDHPKKKIRDTARYPPFKKYTGGRTPSLKKLAKALLDLNIQDGEHCSVEDAQVAMKIYTLHSKEWERAIKTGSLRKMNNKTMGKRKRKPLHRGKRRK